MLSEKLQNSFQVMHDCIDSIEVRVHTKVYFFSVSVLYFVSGELHVDICIV